MEDLSKSQFLALYCMIVADGVIEANELETLYRIGREQYNVPSDEINKNVLSAGSSFVKPDKLEDCVTFLYQLTEIAWADGKIDASERELISRYVVYLGFDASTANEFSDFLIKSVYEKCTLEDVMKHIEV